MQPWPNWWTWELELSPHLLKRMVDRCFNETDLRMMLDEAKGCVPNHEPGRWAITAQHDGRTWEIIVEPEYSDQVLIVVTAYPMDQYFEVSYGTILFLEVTFRKGKPLAGYYYLPRHPGDVSTRSEKLAAGMVVDYAADGRPIGIEFTSPTHTTLADVNRVLTALHAEPASHADLAPLAAS